MVSINMYSQKMTAVCLWCDDGRLGFCREQNCIAGFNQHGGRMIHGQKERTAISNKDHKGVEMLEREGDRIVEVIDGGGKVRASNHLIALIGE